MRQEGTMSLGKIGSFELREKLGEGGMGQVFLASDSRLDREVAIKLLPDSFANDSLRMARFEREAKLLASLNHPNIAAIYGIEEAEGRKALVMEYVPGEDLAKRVRRGPLPLDEALDIAVAIARALEGAHASGIVHRDLKPANVVLRPDGQVKLLDLGLAKSLEASQEDGLDPTESPTISFQATQLGQILGTAAYMSPEQARGRTVDARTDVFSFGCTLFELIAGAPAFSGEDISEILASVIKGDIRWDRLPDDFPAPVRKILARCLETNVDARYQAIGDVRYDLVEYQKDPAGFGGERSADTASGRLSRGLFAVVVLAAVAAGAAISWLLRPDSPPTVSPVVKFAIETGEVSRAVISPDGRHIAYGKDGKVWVRDLDVLEPRLLDLPRRAAPVTWTRDSNTLILSDETMGDDRLWRVDPDGGEPQAIGRLPEAGFSWGVSPLDDDELLLGMANGGLYAMSIATGNTRLLLAGDDRTAATSPIALPGSDAILYGEGRRGVVMALVDGEQRVVFEMEGTRILNPVYSPSGHLLVVSPGGGKHVRAVWAVPFSLEQLAPTGEPFQVARYGDVSISGTGTLVLTRRSNKAPLRRLVWVDRDGTVLGSVAEPLPGFEGPAISPDGTRIAVAASDEFGTSTDIYVIDVGTGAAYRLPDDVGNDRYPWWRDDGTVGYVTWAGGIRHASVRSADGSTPPTLISDRAFYARPSADRRYLVTAYYGLKYFDLDAGETDLDAGETLTMIDDRKGYFADISPDNAYIAYSIVWRGSGLMVRSFPAGDNLTAVTSAQVGAPRWTRDGTEILYWQDESLMSVSFYETADGRPRTGTPKQLFEAGPNRIAASAGFDLAADGRFLMVQEMETPKDESDEPQIIVTENWYREFADRSSR